MYSGMPISQTSKENENWFKKSGVRNIGGTITVKQIQGKRLLGSSQGILKTSVCLWQPWLIFCLATPLYVLLDIFAVFPNLTLISFHLQVDWKRFTWDKLKDSFHELLSSTEQDTNKT